MKIHASQKGKKAGSFSALALGAGRVEIPLSGALENLLWQNLPSLQPTPPDVSDVPKRSLPLPVNEAGRSHRLHFAGGENEAER